MGNLCLIAIKRRTRNPDISTEEFKSDLIAKIGETGEALKVVRGRLRELYSHRKKFNSLDESQLRETELKLKQMKTLKKKHATFESQLATIRATEASKQEHKHATEYSNLLNRLARENGPMIAQGDALIEDIDQVHANVQELMDMNSDVNDSLLQNPVQLDMDSGDLDVGQQLDELFGDSRESGINEFSGVPTENAPPEFPELISNPGSIASDALEPLPSLLPA